MLLVLKMGRGQEGVWLGLCLQVAFHLLEGTDGTRGTQSQSKETSGSLGKKRPCPIWGEKRLPGAGNIWVA